ncbi:hypothetical protein [Streptomyces sp. MAR4 CNX-425]|uniref:hypothetical protein n=1 Tax=Streptomyces sp. MAR4 CNX-425 TaxID=3406343 RepID=UPI003B50DFD4
MRTNATRTNRTGGLAATVVSAVAGGALVLGTAGPVAAGPAGLTGPQAAPGGGRSAAAAGAAAPAAADVDASTLRLLAELGRLTDTTARAVERIQRAVADGGRLHPRTLPDYRSPLDAVGAAAKTRGRVKSMKARETTALAEAVASLRTELAGLVRAGEAGDRTAVDERASVAVAALVRVLSAAAASGLVPAGQPPGAAAANAAEPPELPAGTGA